MTAKFSGRYCLTRRARHCAKEALKSMGIPRSKQTIDMVYEQYLVQKRRIMDKYKEEFNYA